MPNEKTFTICMLSSQHHAMDDRIYWKEARSLQKAGYQLIHISAGDNPLDYITVDGIRLIQVVRKKYFRNSFIDKFARFAGLRPQITGQIFDSAAGTNADAFHFHDVQICKITARLKALPQRPKIIYDVHESYGDLIRGHSSPLLAPFNFFYSRYIENREMASARHCDAIITTETYVQQKFALALPGIPCLIIYNYSYFLPNRQLVSKTPKIYDAVYSGTITAERGIYELVEAIKLLRADMPAVKCLVIGSFAGSVLQQRVREKIAQYGLTENLLLHDAAAFEKMSEFYLQSKIGLCLVHPIKLYRNAVFIKVFEYMAFGLPVIGSNFGTVAHYIETANAGITANPLEPRAIATAIAHLLQSAELYKTCSNNGMNAVEEHYNWQQEEKKLLELYNRFALYTG